MKTALILAMTRSGLMGRDNSLPWHWPADLAHFKRTTKGHPVVMGRLTFDSLLDNFGGPLKGRTNVVVSRAKGGKGAEGVERDGARWFATLPAAIRWLDDQNDERGPDEAFILGGAQIFRLAVETLDPKPGRVVVTWVPDVDEKPGDTFWPFTPPEAWLDEHYEAAERWHDDTGQLEFVNYTRRSG
ncbi:MAG: dihydrofolate reductase [Planctomycetota bacterium]